jgi:mannose-1-phosphate guanylyltransferase / mannose-6-phosphate isomerase
MTSSPKSGLVHPAILSGGSGTRLWPLSRREFPKQLLPLVTPTTLLQDTATRMSGACFAPPLIICNRDHRFLIAEQLRAAGIAGATIVLEPAGRNTAPAAVVAALLAAESDTDAIVLLAPSDHAVHNIAAFESAVAAATAAARAGALVTFGITPDAPETGYGYVQRGGAISDAPGAFRVARFVEKPDRKTAETYLAAGDYFWNSGMFLFSAATLLQEMAQLQPEILEACRQAVTKGHRDADFFRLDETEFLASPSNSLDYALMEHTTHAAIVPVDMGWSDVGSWGSLWDISEKSGDKNVVRGDVLLTQTRNCYLRSDGPLIAAVGVDDLVVVATNDAVLVTRRDAAQDVKKIVDELERQGRSEHIRHRGPSEKS